MKISKFDNNRKRASLWSPNKRTPESWRLFSTDSVIDMMEELRWCQESWDYDKILVHYISMKGNHKTRLKESA